MASTAKLRRRHAEIGQRPFQRQPRRGLGLPQQIAEVAFFAALAPARGGRPDAGRVGLRGSFFPEQCGFFRGRRFSMFCRFVFCRFAVWRLSRQPRFCFCHRSDRAHDISALIIYQCTYNASDDDVT
jgi:hypothetical protein